LRSVFSLVDTKSYKHPANKRRHRSVNCFMKLFLTSQSKGDESGVNISPMIDMVFILLIFFVVTAVFVEECGFEATTPDSQSIPRPDPPPTISIYLDQNELITMDGKEVSKEYVRSKVAQSWILDGEMNVTVYAKAQTNAGFLVQVLDEVRMGGVANVSMALDI